MKTSTKLIIAGGVVAGIAILGLAYLGNRVISDTENAVTDATTKAENAVTGTINSITSFPGKVWDYLALAFGSAKADVEDVGGYIDNSIPSFHDSGTLDNSTDDTGAGFGPTGFDDL